MSRLKHLWNDSALMAVILAGMAVAMIPLGFVGWIVNFWWTIPLSPRYDPTSTWPHVGAMVATGYVSVGVLGVPLIIWLYWKSLSDRAKQDREAKVFNEERLKQSYEYNMSITDLNELWCPVCGGDCHGDGGEYCIDVPRRKIELSDVNAVSIDAADFSFKTERTEGDG